MLFPVMVVTKPREGSMSSRFLSMSNQPELFVLVTPLIFTILIDLGQGCRYRCIKMYISIAILGKTVDLHCKYLK